MSYNSYKVLFIFRTSTIISVRHFLLWYPCTFKPASPQCPHLSPCHSHSPPVFRPSESPKNHPWFIHSALIALILKFSLPSDHLSSFPQIQHFKLKSYHCLLAFLPLLLLLYSIVYLAPEVIVQIKKQVSTPRKSPPQWFLIALGK